MWRGILRRIILSGVCVTLGRGRRGVSNELSVKVPDLLAQTSFMGIPRLAKATHRQDTHECTSRAALRRRTVVT